MSEDYNPNTDVDIIDNTAMKLIARLKKKIDYQRSQIRNLRIDIKNCRNDYETLLHQQQRLKDREHFLQKKINKLTSIRRIDSDYEDSAVQSVKSNIQPKITKLSSHNLIKSHSQEFD